MPAAPSPPAPGGLGVVDGQPRPTRSCSTSSASSTAATTPPCIARHLARHDGGARRRALGAHVPQRARRPGPGRRRGDLIDAADLRRHRRRRRPRSTPTACSGTASTTSLTKVRDVDATGRRTSSGAFNRTVTQRVGALQDHYLARDRPLGASRVLWEIGADGCDVRLLRCPARPRRRVPEPPAAVARGRRARDGRPAATATAACARPGSRRAGRRRAPAARPRAATTLAASLLAPLSAAPARRRSSRRWTASTGCSRPRSCTIDVVDPATPDAQACLAAYFAELDERFDAGFDPARSLTAGVDEHAAARTASSSSPACTASPSAAAASSCTPSAPAYIKRMWVDPAARGLVARPPAARRARGAGRRARRDGRPAGDEPGARRGDRHVPLGGLQRGRPVQRRALRRSLVREATAPLGVSFTPPETIRFRTVRTLGERRRAGPSTETPNGRWPAPPVRVASPGWRRRGRAGRPAPPYDDGQPDDVAGARHGGGGPPRRRDVDEVVGGPLGARRRSRPPGVGSVSRRFAVPSSDAVMSAGRPGAQPDVERADHRGRQQVARCRGRAPAPGAAPGRSTPPAAAPAAAMPQLIWTRLSKPRRGAHGPHQP